MFKVLATLILVLIFSLSNAADAVKFIASHPSSYVVIKGDTLWGISAKFLTDPWLWPKVWKHNGQIKNPHLIYPGDIISFCWIDGNPMLCVNNANTHNNDVNNTHNNERILYPHIRLTDNDDAIAMIPFDAISPYLNSSRVVSKDELANAPYIIDFVGEHLIAGTGDEIYVRSILKPEFLTYTTYRLGETYINPQSGEILGYAAEYIADNTIVNLGDPATLRITNANSVVRRGDRLMPTSTDTLVFNYFPKPPKKFIQGLIISVLNGVQEIGTYDIIVLNKGARDGLKVADILTIMQAGKVISDPYNKNQDEWVTLPDQKAGVAMVFRVFDRVCYALVMQATRNIRKLDKVQTPE